MTLGPCPSMLSCSSRMAATLAENVGLSAIEPKNIGKKLMTLNTSQARSLLGQTCKESVCVRCARGLTVNTHRSPTSGKAPCCVREAYVRRVRFGNGRNLDGCSIRHLCLETRFQRQKIQEIVASVPRDMEDQKVIRTRTSKASVISSVFRP